MFEKEPVAGHKHSPEVQAFIDRVVARIQELIEEDGLPMGNATRTLSTELSEGQDWSGIIAYLREHPTYLATALWNIWEANKPPQHDNALLDLTHHQIIHGSSVMYAGLVGEGLSPLLDFWTPVGRGRPRKLFRHCSKVEVLSSAEYERQRAKAPLMRAAFREAVATRMNTKQTVEQKYTEKQLRKILDDTVGPAGEEVIEPE